MKRLPYLRQINESVKNNWTWDKYDSLNDFVKNIKNKLFANNWQLLEINDGTVYAGPAFQIDKLYKELKGKIYTYDDIDKIAGIKKHTADFYKKINKGVEEIKLGNKN